MGMYSQNVKILVQECDALLLQFVNVKKNFDAGDNNVWTHLVLAIFFFFWMEYDQDLRGYIYLLLELEF